MRVTALLKGLQFIGVPYDDLLQLFKPLSRAGWDVTHNKGHATQYFKIVALKEGQKFLLVVEPDRLTFQTPSGKKGGWAFPSQLQKALIAIKKYISQV